MKTKPKATVIYDGSCKMCSGNLKWLIRLDTLHRFESMPYQDPEVFKRFPQLKLKECMEAIHVVLPNGIAYAGVPAFREIFLRMPFMFILGLVLAIPPISWMASWLYKKVAKNRYKISGTCPL